MRKLIVVLFMCVFALAACGCSGSNNHDGEVQAPIGASSAKGENYEDVARQLETAGFTNVQLEGNGELIIGLLHDEGDVDEVSIDGKTSFSADKWFPEDAPVIVRFYSYDKISGTLAEIQEANEKAKEEKEAEERRQNEEREAKEREAAEAQVAEEENRKAEQEALDKLNSVEGATAQEGIAIAKELGFEVQCKDADGDDVSAFISEESFAPFAESAIIKTVEANYSGDKAVVLTLDSRYVLTVDNNEDLRNLLAVADPNDPLVKAFAEKYKGAKIEFDGCFNNVQQHGSYNNRFDFLIGVGDYSPDSAIGPNFKFEDKNTSDLHIEDVSIDTITEGINARFVARVDEYNEQSELFFLKPIKTYLR